MAALRVLAVAVARRHVAFVLLIDGALKDWAISDRAARSATDAVEIVQGWINALKPDVVVTEKTDGRSRKGARTRGLIAAIAMVAEHNYVLDIAVPHEHDHPGRHEEAVALAERHPVLRPWLPRKRRIFDHPPRNLVLFEALSLAEAVLRGPTARLAAAMG